MITASSLFNALPPFSEGADPSSAGARAGGSAADAFAALLAGLDPADLQDALSPSAQSTGDLNAGPTLGSGVHLEEASAASSDSAEGAVPLLPLPVLLNVHTAGSSRPDVDKQILEGCVDEEETPQQEPVLDPLAFLLTQGLSPVPDRAPLVALPPGLAAAIANVETIANVDATLQGRPEGDGAVSEDARTFTPALPESSEGAGPVAEAISPIELAETEAPAVDRAEQPARITPLPAVAPKPAERAPAQEASAPLPESFEPGTVSADRPPIDLRKSVDDTARSTWPSQNSPGRPGPLDPATYSVADAQQEIPRDTGEANPQGVDGRWVQAVKRFMAQAAVAAEVPQDSGNTAPLAAERNTLSDSLRFAVKGTEERLAALTQSPEFQGGNRDQQASQRGAAESLLLHASPIASSASSAAQFAMPVMADEAPTPEDAALARQIVQAAHLQWRNGGGDARLTLHPEYLGEVQISIRVESGTVTATMKAAEPEVRAWMQAHESLLKQGLAEQGLRLDELHVEDGSEEREAGRNPGGDRQPPQQRPRTAQASSGTVPVFELPL